MFEKVDCNEGLREDKECAGKEQKENVFVKYALLSSPRIELVLL